MSRPAASHPPYPISLTRRRYALRQIIFNQLFAIMGLAATYATAAALSPQKTAVLSPLYYFIWVELMICIGLLINGSGMLWTMRYAWRHLPDEQASYNRDGLLKRMPASAKRRMLLVVAMCPPASSWLVYKIFIAIQDTHWGHANLDQVHPTYTTTLLNLVNGFVMACIFEYLYDRWHLHAERARSARKLTTEAQLQLLRSQLDPHMLFNTLSNLYELIDANPKQARAMLLHLIGFLRSTLDGSRATQHALGDEFRLASDYLSLMQIRMGERLRATLDLPDALRAVPVPAMLLQPVIENAIKHGLEPRKHGGDLSVTATQEAGQLVLRVRNSGISEAFRDDGPLARKPGGFGLRSVKDRLDMLCGPGDHLELTHIHDEDLTQVTVRLPLRPAMEVAA